MEKLMMMKLSCGKIDLRDNIKIKGKQIEGRITFMFRSNL